jgi:Zn-dependent protease with chaperone function
MSGPDCGTCSADGVVELAAVVLLVFGVLLAEPLSRALADARWPARDPVGALLVWQAVGLAGGLSLVGAGIVYGLAPLGPDLPAALRALVALPSAVLWLPFHHLLALLAGLALAGWLLAVLAVTASRTLLVRRRHRDLIDVLTTPWPAVPGARVLDHPVPVAYCLPGRRSRLVLSAGALDALDPVQVDAVLAHERAHLRERHDLVVLPFVAWGTTAPFVRGMVCAQVAVAALIEMRADDVAAARVAPAELAGALRAVGGAVPAAALSSFSAALDRRLGRIVAHPAPLPTSAKVLVRATAAALVVVPAAALLLG